MDTLTLFSKNLNQRSLTPRWPLTPCLLRSHVWLYPRIIVSKSHDNTSMYVDTVINFAKYHIHTYTYILRTYYVHTTYILHTTYRMSDHIVSYWTQFRRDKKLISKISVDSNFMFSSYTWLCVFHCSHRLLCWINSRVQEFSVKIALISYWNASSQIPLGECAS